MSAAITSLSELCPSVKDAVAFFLEYLHRVIDQTLNQYETYTKQFLLELQLMKAIEHEYFNDANNIKTIQAVYSRQEIQNLQISVEEDSRHNILEKSQMQLGNEKKSQFPRADTPMQKMIEQLLLNMKIEDGEEDMETTLAELLLSLKLKTRGGDFSEATLVELLSYLDLKKSDAFHTTLNTAT